jgi:hypothetical protein
MSDTLAMIGYGLLLVLISVIGILLFLFFIACTFAMLALPVVIVIWAIGAFL